MGKLLGLCGHCSATQPKTVVDYSFLKQIHMGPKDLDDGRVKYKGKIYDKRLHLPNEHINGVHIRLLHGHGWDRIGYVDVIPRLGRPINLVPYNEDDWITRDEMTWGVSGYNGSYRHFVLAGGYRAKATDRFFDHFTNSQFMYTVMYIKEFLKHHPGAVIVGHNDLAVKGCPGFQMSELLNMADLGKHYGGKQL